MIRRTSSLFSTEPLRTLGNTYNDPMNRNNRSPRKEKTQWPDASVCTVSSILTIRLGLQSNSSLENVSLHPKDEHRCTNWRTLTIPRYLSIDWCSVITGLRTLETSFHTVILRKDRGRKCLPTWNKSKWSARDQAHMSNPFYFQLNATGGDSLLSPPV